MTPDELALEVALSGVRHLQGNYQIYVSSPSTTLVRGARGRGPRTGNPALWAELDLWSRRHHIEFIWCPVGRVMDEARALAYRAIDLFQDELSQEAPEKS